MNVKICGVTTIEDALMCVEAGAGLIGLNFYPKSPRCVTRETASRIAVAVRNRSHDHGAVRNHSHDHITPPITLVGVFVNESAEMMMAVLEECGLDLAQLSGDERDEVVTTMGERGFKAIRHSNNQLPITTNQLLLFDAHAAGQYGGTGKPADWESAAWIATRYRLLLAGGLTPENVSAAIAQVRPWGVDVASGVEASPGVKDREKVIGFIKAAQKVIGY